MQPPSIRKGKCLISFGSKKKEFFDNFADNSYMVRSIRGAVHFKEDSKELTTEKVQHLIEKMISENQLCKDDIVNIFFTVTDDLKSINPAASLREDKNYSDIPLFCAIEPKYKDSLIRTIRIMMTVNSILKNNELKHIYIDGAEMLRPDLEN